MSRFSGRLRTRLVVLALVAVVPALIALAYTQFQERRRARERTLADNLRLARLAANQQGNVFDGVHRLLLTLSELPDLLADDPRHCAELLPRILRDHPGYLDVTVFESDGSLFCTGAKASRYTEIQQEAWFRRVLQTRTTTISDYEFEQGSSQLAVAVAHPIPGPTGDVRRVIVAMIGLNQLNNVAANAELPPGATLTLFDRTGTILARYPDSAQWVGRRVPQSLSVQHLLDGARMDQTESAGVDGVVRLYVTVPVVATLPTGLYVGMGVDRATAFAEADLMLRQLLQLIALVSLGAIAVAGIAGELMVSGPTKTLTQVTDQIARGDFSARARLPGRVATLAELGDAVNRMATALETRQRERDRAEKELRDSEDRYRLLFEQNPHPMWVYDPETLAFLEVNDAAVQHYGYSRAEFLGMRITDIRPGEDVPRLIGVLEGIRHPWSKAGTWQHRLRSGELIDVDITAHTLVVNERTAVLVTAQDVTARTIAERAIAERACLAALTADVGAALNKPDVLKPCLQSCADALVEHFAAAARIWTVSASGSSLELQASAGFRTDLDDVHERILVGERTAGRIAETRRAYHTNSLESDSTVDERDWAKRKGITAFAGYPLVVDERVVGVMAIFTHASLSEAMTGALSSVANHVALGIKRHHTEEARRLLASLVEAAEERTRFALEASRVGVWEADLRTGSCNWSPVLERLHGLGLGSFGGTLDAFIDCIDPADRQAARDAIGQATRERHDAQIVYRTTWPDGTAHWISTVGRVFYDHHDETPIRAAGVAMDVTDRRVLEDQLRQSQKMEAIGQLAGGIAHDFNNLLTAIQGYAEFLTESLREGDPCRADVDEISSAAKRAAALTRQLLAFSRKQILAPKVVQVGDVVSGVTPMLRRLIGETIDLKTITGEKGHVKADAGQLEQILVNLALNARDAMAHGGHLTIETADVWLDHAYARLHPSVTAGQHVLIAVSDTGHGMDAQTKARVFEPFFTTKPKGQGTGLGLAMVYGFVKQSNGHVWVYSEINRGTTFKVYLPTTGEPVMGEPVVSTYHHATRGTETILLVEDEDVVRDFASKVLGRHGYVVHAVGGPSRAIEYARSYRGAIDVLLSDVVLPEMNGRALAERIQELHPEVKILFMSGYTDNAIVHHGVLDEGMWFLQKPFSAQALMERVRDLFEATAGTRREATL